ncbi:threonine synthase [Xanthomonas translucens]|uniref:threonine synthase n=2 Tax=Xanthomonas campestris pv. translucens TaxID=343 RepID=UPI0002A7A273|nr:threonine synthase [Xanthomonas translucens]ELQ07479.1 threonine synthase [Xanthomonas translucens DAR61454]MBC3972273.1 threonine synthase [Xanthomonas translucens pv. undulosa]MCT8283412.1 threonine synthase [Xanthomonas translucens pv. undulosa]MCT8318230.1 threonine synthase [Xanthomonas translucens pv. undulosa]QSQ40776.1 threonine synthase [Xanthomonas translucens pv. translucens]
MNFISTRHAAPAATLSQAIAAGLAPDGGLYVPERMPPARALRAGANLAETAADLLAPFFDGDALAAELPAICAEAFDFDAPLQPLATPGDHALELFHGPTAAFKDFGARFLAACLTRLRRDAATPLTILVATSGDTGAAVAAAFHRQPGLRVVVLYPDGRVSPRQAHQLGCFGDNIQALRVAGSFDDCQALVKQALRDVELQAQAPLSSANSISLGRLLPQMSYYAHSVLVHYAAHAQALNLVVPTGNLGNALAAILARGLGVPLGRIVLATNANHVLPDYFAGADYAPQPSVATVANAMDVGAPSNFERLRWLYRGDDAALRAQFQSYSVDDAQIRQLIGERFRRYGEVHCPHTATALHVLQQIRAEGAEADAGDWAVAATAHPAKFEAVVEPLIGQPVPVPPALAALLQRPAQAEPIAPDYAALRARLLAG